MIDRLSYFLFEPISPEQNQRVKIGLSFTLLFISLCSLIVYQGVLTGQYQGEIFNDDIRIYFWLNRFIDPELFPNDLIANYFEAVTPRGYTFVFFILSKLGIKPLLVMQIIPLFIIIFSSAYVFLLSLEILPIITFGFLTTTLSWLTFFPSDPLPRSFFLVLFPAFLYYLIRDKLLLLLGAIILLGLFYTPFLFLIIGLLIVRLFQWKRGRFVFADNRRDYTISIIGILIAAIPILCYVISSQQFLPSTPGSEAIKMPEFWYPNGRTPYYSDNILDTYIFGWQSGLKPGKLLKSSTRISLLSFGLPFILCFSSMFPLVSKVRKDVLVLFQIVGVSLTLNLLAHLVFFKLYFPNRYTRFPLSFVIVFASSLSLFILFQSIWCWLSFNIHLPVITRKIAVIAITTLLGGYCLLYPFYLSFQKSPRAFYHNPSLESFFTKQPKDIMIASLEELPSNNIPTFSRRSVLTGGEFTVPYHLKYYIPIKQKTTDLINAHYTDDLSHLKKFIEQYSIDFFVMRESTFSPEFIKSNVWLKQWKDIAQEIEKQRKAGKVSILWQIGQNCTDFKSNDWLVVSSQCILDQP